MKLDSEIELMLRKLGHVHDLTINTIVEFKATDFIFQYTVFENCIFEDSVTFKSVDFQIGIVFKNCKFKKNLILYSCAANGVDKEDYLDFVSVRFVNCEVGYLDLENNKFERGLKILQKNEQGKIDVIKIKNLLSKMGGIAFEGLKAGSLDLFDIYTEESGIQFQKCDLEHLRMSGNILGSLSFIETTFIKDIYIWGGQIGSLIFNNNIFKDLVTIQKVQNTSQLTISGYTFQKDLLIDLEDSEGFGQVTKLHIASTKFSNSFILNGDGKKIDEITIRCSQDLAGSFEFTSCVVSNLILSGNNHKANINFKYCQFKSLMIANFYNYSNLSFSSCGAVVNPDSSLIIEDSDLGKTKFLNFSFTEFASIDIINSIISEVNSTAVKWFSDSRLTTGNNQRHPNRVREVYRQLKQSSEKQGDRIQALEFQALELSAFKEEVTIRKKFLSGDRLILWLSRTNSFGLNWLKPLGLIFLITVIFYVPMGVYSSEKISFYPSYKVDDIVITIKELLYHSDIFVQLFNPTHNLKQFFPITKTINPLIFWLDGIHRIILAFFIVQIISAFRKFIK